MKTRSQILWRVGPSPGRSRIQGRQTWTKRTSKGHKGTTWSYLTGSGLTHTVLALQLWWAAILVLGQEKCKQQSPAPGNMAVWRHWLWCQMHTLHTHLNRGADICPGKSSQELFAFNSCGGVIRREGQGSALRSAGFRLKQPQPCGQ